MHGWQWMLHSSTPDLIDLSIFHFPSRKNSFVNSPHFSSFAEILLTLRAVWLLLSSADWAYGPKPLRVWRAASVCRVPAELPAAAAACCRQDRTQPCLPAGSQRVLAEEQPLLWQSEASVQTLLSLFTAFTLVQLRSLLQSKYWQAIFINHVRLNVFKCMYLRTNNHALVLFLFSSRPWGFFALFSLAYTVWCKGFSSVWKLVF